MKYILRVLSFILIVAAAYLVYWGINITDTKERISVFGVAGIIFTAIVSTFTIIENNREAKEREFERLMLEKRREVFEVFFDNFAEIQMAMYKDDLQRDNKKTNVKRLINSEDYINKITRFKLGLINYSSEKGIKDYIAYEEAATSNSLELDKKLNYFISIRKELGFNDSNDLNPAEIILTPEARRQFRELRKKR